MRPRLFVIASVLLLFPLQFPGTAMAGTFDGERDDDGFGVGGGDGSGGGGGTNGGGGSPANPDAPRYETVRLPDCPGNDPSTGRAWMCAQALNCPQNPDASTPAADDPDTISDDLWIRSAFWRRQTAPRTTEWMRGEVRCVNLADVDSGPSLAELIVGEWRRTVLPRATTKVQPAGRTLVGVPTIVWTTTGTQTYNLRILGNAVTLRAVPTRYTWTFGDGASTSTGRKGRPWPATDITHVYRRPAAHSLSVSVTFRGEYRVAGSGWVPIAGTVTRPGRAVGITVVEQRTTLVDAD